MLRLLSGGEWDRRNVLLERKVRVETPARDPWGRQVDLRGGARLGLHAQGPLD